MARALALCLVSVFTALGAPTLTRIQDTLYKADGSRFEGVLQISWRGFRASDGAEIAQNLISVRIVYGQFSIALVPTTNAIQPTTYTVRYNSDGRTQFSEFWSVPPTSAVLRVSDVRTHSSSAGSITTEPVTVDIQNVSGLRTELDLRPARGATWAAGRAAVIGGSGAIEAAVGSAGDCIHVDGTSGPCGVGAARFVDGETPQGTIDGVNTVFRLSAAPDPPVSLNLYRNGVLQSNLSVSGSTVIFPTGSAPRTGDSLSAWYRLASDSTESISYADLEVPTGAVNGTNRDFTLSAIPMPASSLRVYRNGLLQKGAVDYTLAVDRITFMSVATPQSGDLIQATFRK
jgi:hypothetical protein